MTSEELQTATDSLTPYIQKTSGYLRALYYGLAVLLQHEADKAVAAERPGITVGRMGKPPVLPDNEFES